MKKFKMILALALVIVSVFAIAAPALAASGDYRDYFSSNTLKRSSQYKEAVKNLQIALNYLGYNCGTADGIFGSRTEDAVENFQRANPPLAVDGECGSGTKPVIWQQIPDSLKNVMVKVQ